MTPETHARLLRWRESGSPVQKKHAEYSLARHEGRSLDPPAPRPRHVDPWTARIRACEDFNPGCCHSPAPYCTRYHINPTRDRCIACLGDSPVSLPGAPGG